MISNIFTFDDDATYNFIESYLTSSLCNNYRIDVNAVNLKLNPTEFSYRTINHWENEGIINDNRPNGKGWRKYSMIDRVWIGVISKLRDFGVSLDKIKLIKEAMEENSMGEFENEMTALEAAFILAKIHKTQTLIVITENDEVFITSIDEYINSVNYGTIKHSIVISLNAIIKDLFPNEDTTPIKNNLFDLGKKELEILFLIRSGEFSSITVKTQDGEISMYETSRTIEDETRIVDILRKAKHQDINIKMKNGNIVHIENVVKHK